MSQAPPTFTVSLPMPPTTAPPSSIEPRLPRVAIAVVTLLTFALATHLQELLSLTEFYRSWYERYPFYVPEGLKTTLQIALVLTVTGALYRGGPGGVAAELGLTRPVIPAFTVALIATTPLLVGLALTRRVDPKFAPVEVFYTAGYSSFAEDLVYTGFAVRQLYRRARWPFWLAVLGVAVVFGLGHVEKGSTLGQMAGLFAFTAVGLALFAWMFTQWGDNLWVPVSLHLLLDLWWAVFAAGDTAVSGGWVPMALAAASVGVAVALTLRRRQQGRALSAAVPLQPAEPAVAADVGPAIVSARTEGMAPPAPRR